MIDLSYDISTISLQHIVIQYQYCISYKYHCGIELIWCFCDQGTRQISTYCYNWRNRVQWLTPSCYENDAVLKTMMSEAMTSQV